MKKIKYLFLITLITYHSKILASDAGILGGVSTDKLRNGDIHVDDIPLIISYAIDFLMGIAGTISVVFIIIGAYKLAFGSLSQDTSKGKETIVLALSGFALASLSWIILKLIINNFA